MLTTSDDYVVHVPQNGFQDQTLHHLPRAWGETDWPAVPWILLPSRLENRSDICFPPIFGPFSQSPWFIKYCWEFIVLAMNLLAPSTLVGTPHQGPWTYVCPGCWSISHLILLHQGYIFLASSLSPWSLQTGIPEADLWRSQSPFFWSAWF